MDYIVRLLKKHDIPEGRIDIGRVIDLLRRGERIAAVKLVVDQSGAGLKKSKDLCDDLQKEVA
ncbi:MAG: hypothetical protein JXB30_06395 [Anaerolineae bacterium]|nr:hypothetical protein [Anaerolineae bacterium]